MKLQIVIVIKREKIKYAKKTIYSNEVIIMPKCVNCGHIFKTSNKDSRKNVKSCHKCTRLFPDNYLEPIMKDFFKF